MFSGLPLIADIGVWHLRDGGKTIGRFMGVTPSRAVRQQGARLERPPRATSREHPDEKATTGRLSSMANHFGVLRGLVSAYSQNEDIGTAQKAIPKAGRAEACSLQMEGYGGPAQPSPTIGQCLNGGYGWLEVECHRWKTRASIPLDAIRRPRDTPIWKLEAALKCRSCKKDRYAPPVHMIKLTETREITPYKWIHPDEER